MDHERSGRVAAERWLSTNPTFNVEALTDVEKQMGIRSFLVNVQDAYTPAERLYFLLTGDEQDRSDSAEFWESLLCEAHPDVDELDAFASSLLEAAPV